MRYSISSDETNKETLCVDVKRQDKKYLASFAYFDKRHSNYVQYIELKDHVYNDFLTAFVSTVKRASHYLSDSPERNDKLAKQTLEKYVNSLKQLSFDF